MDLGHSPCSVLMTGDLAGHCVWLLVFISLSRSEKENLDTFWQQHFYQKQRSFSLEINVLNHLAALSTLCAGTMGVQYWLLKLLCQNLLHQIQKQHQQLSLSPSPENSNRSLFEQLWCWHTVHSTYQVQLGSIHCLLIALFLYCKTFVIKKRQQCIFGSEEKPSRKSFSLPGTQYMYSIKSHTFPAIYLQKIHAIINMDSLHTKVL